MSCTRRCCIRCRGFTATPTKLSPQSQFIVTLGISIALQSACTIFFGSDVRSIRTSLSSTAWSLDIPFTQDGMVFFNQARVVTCIAGAVCAVALHILINRTRFGKTLRATADNAIAATYMAINVERMHRLAFALGTAITAVAGALVALQYPFQPYVGLDFIIVMYTGVVLGGMGSIIGALWGGMAIGVIQQCATLFLQPVTECGVFVVFIAILLVRPQSSPDVPRAPPDMFREWKRDAAIILLFGVIYLAQPRLSATAISC